jgi:hypothetical protein
VFQSLGLYIGEPIEVTNPDTILEFLTFSANTNFMQKSHSRQQLLHGQ